MSQENVDLVRRSFDLLNRERTAALDRFDDYANPDMELRAVGRLPDTHTVVRGREGIKAWFVQLYASLDMRLEADEFVDAGDSVVVVFRQIARGRASGAEVTNRFAFVYGFRQGKIACVDGYRTKQEALEAAGLRK